MEEIPPGGRPGPWMQGGGYYSSRTPAKAERVEFSDEQKREVADALREAEVALLRAITRSADLADTYYAARSTVRLTHALATLRVAAGQALPPSPFFPEPPPWFIGPEGPEDLDEP
jgi:hypothetical protein